MVYTRGNTAIQQTVTSQKHNDDRSPHEKSQQIAQKTGILLREKLLYLGTIIVFFSVSAVLMWRYAYIYDLNKQVQEKTENIVTNQKKLLQLQTLREKLSNQVLEQVEKLGYIKSSDRKFIFVPR